MQLSSEHRDKVGNICERIKELRAEKILARVYKGSTNSTRTLRFKKREVVDISDLDNVLSVCREKMVAIVEPNVAFDKLVREVGKYGLVPAVVPEFPGITIGGGIAGGAGESSSFRDGLVHTMSEEYEVVLGDGSIVYASAKENTDLFLAMAGTYGSLGIITAIKLKLIPKTKYVRLSYFPVTSFKEATERTVSLSKECSDFVDGIMFAPDKGILMAGSRTDNKEGLPVHRFSRAWDEWFYLHAKKRMEYPQNDIVPLEDYLFRYDRGTFWMGAYGFSRFLVPFNRLTRFFHNHLCKARVMYKAIQETDTSQQYFVQDLSVPARNFVELLSYTNEKLGIYPLWICPLMTDKCSAFSPTHLGDEMVLNLGIWGPYTGTHDDFVKINIDFENKTRLFGGRKILYAHVYEDEENFWQSYDKKLYNSLRDKYEAQGPFPSLFDKVVVREQYTPHVKRGFVQAFRPFWKQRLS